MHGPRYFESFEEKGMEHVDACNKYGEPMAQPLPYAYNDFDENTSLETILATENDAEIGYFVKLDLN